MAPLKAALSLAGALGLQAGFLLLFLCVPAPGDADTTPGGGPGDVNASPRTTPPGEDQGMPTPPPGPPPGRDRGCQRLPQDRPRGGQGMPLPPGLSPGRGDASTSPRTIPRRGPGDASTSPRTIPGEGQGLQTPPPELRTRSRLQPLPLSRGRLPTLPRLLCWSQRVGDAARDSTGHSVLILGLWPSRPVDSPLHPPSRHLQPPLCSEAFLTRVTAAMRPCPLECWGKKKTQPGEGPPPTQCYCHVLPRGPEPPPVRSLLTTYFSPE